VRHPYLEAEIDKAGVRRLAREIGLGTLSELPAAPCRSSRVETGIPIEAGMLKAIPAVERRLAQEFPAGTIRCRVRATGVVVELDPATLAAVAGPREADVRRQVAALFAGKVAHTDPTFAPYRNGSAFLHGRA
jgi:pyridinium-3,5-biscarboxylic acid mononucleotide sulfurtransferase